MKLLKQNVFKIFALFAIFFMLTTCVYASNVKINIDGIDISSKAKDVVVGKMDYDDSSIVSNATLFNKDDYVTFKVTLVNNDSTDYTITSITDDNTSKYIKTDYKSDEIIKSGEKASFYMTLTLDKLVDDINDIDEDDFYNLGKINITLNLVDSDNNTQTITITSNPNTGDNIIVYVILIVLSLAGLVFGTFMIRKNKKIFGLLLVICVSLVSVYTYATQKYDISLIFEKNNVRVKVETFNLTLIDENNDEIIIKMISNKDYILDLEEPSKKGYIFKGWSTEENGKAEYHNGDKINSDKDLTFYPEFEIINYSITYNTNGADEANLPSTYTVEDDILLPNLTKKGYTFTGWTEENGDTPQTDYKIEKGTIGNQILNANFTKDEYTLKYDTADGSNQPVHTQAYYVDSDDISIPNPSKDGYTFAGWYDESNVNHGKDLTIPTGSTGDLNLTAKYDLIQYNVELNTGTGTVQDTYNVENKINLTDPTRDGYIFKGWTYTNGGTTPDITENPTALDISKSDNDTIKLYAIWEKVTITLSNVDTSDFVAGNKINYTATVSPSYLADQVTWTSSNSHATVSNGEVTGVSEGSVTITASVAGASASKTINVKKAIAYLPNTGIYYSSLQKGINAVSATATTDQARKVQLLANTAESINVSGNRNVIVEFQNHALNGGFMVGTNCQANISSGTINGPSNGVALWVRGNAVANNMTLNGNWGILTSFEDDTAGNLLKDSNGDFLTGDAYEQARLNRAIVRANNCTINATGFNNEVRHDTTIYLTNCSIIGTGAPYQIPNHDPKYHINNKAGRIYDNGTLHD